MFGIGFSTSTISQEANEPHRYADEMAFDYTMKLNASIVPETSDRNSVHLVHLPLLQHPSCLASLITGAAFGVLPILLSLALVELD